MKSATYAVLNFKAVQQNLAVVRRHAPLARIMAVIKANGYGHGLLRIAHAVQQADAFAVARMEEAIQLREAGFAQRILLLEGISCAAELQAVVNYQLEQVVHCAEQIELLEQWQGAEKQVVWLKVDTGMNRLGFKPGAFESAYHRLQNCTAVDSQIHLMTHLANADDTTDLMTLKQLDLFNQTVQNFLGQRSVANSAGILGWTQTVSDWVRPGLMLYGMSPFVDKTAQQLGLKPLMSVYSKLIAIKSLQAGERVGYSGTWMCDKPTRLGVVAIGYGDGYPRHAKSGTPVLINGQRVPLVGRVSMDMLTVDITTQPTAKIGDCVTLWGDGLPIEEIAACADTIPYTLTCGITQRVKILVES